MTNSVDPDQTAPIGAVCSGSTLFASILNSSVMLGNFLQQTTSADDILDAFLCPQRNFGRHKVYAPKGTLGGIQLSHCPSVCPSRFVSGAYLVYSLR